MLDLVEFHPSENRRERKRFIEFAWTVNRQDPAWVPPLRLTVEDALDTRKNPFYQHAEIRLWNAYRKGVQVGRIAAIVDKRHNEFHQEQVGFWGFFESIDEGSVATALFQAAEKWIKQKGMRAVRGPASPSFNHECGLLMNNFGRAPYVMMTHNPEYYAQLVLQQKYSKAKDLLAFEMPTPEEFEPRIVRIMEKVKKKSDITIRPINMKRFAEEIAIIKDIYNSAWEKNWGFVPMDDSEFNHMAKSLKDILWPQFCLIAFAKDKPIGFSLSLPDINQVLIKIPSGRLLPFGIFRLLTGLRPKAKQVTRVRVLTLGVRPEWRTSGVASVFYYETYRQCKVMGLDGGECSWILEDNREMLSAMGVFLGAPPYKTYRVFEKNI